MAVLENLLRRRIEVDDDGLCVICRNNVETVSHALCHYSFATQLWNKVMEREGVLWWSIWLARNDTIFQNFIS